MDHVHTHTTHQHTHSHGHSHGHHHHAVNFKNINNAFIIGIAFNFLFVLIEVIVGLSIHSLSLLSDAGHNLADVASLSMSLIAFRLLKVKPNEKYTYGYKKTTVLVALLNAAILLVSIGAIGYEAIHRIISPEPLPGKTISIVAAIGIVINTFTALLFLRNKDSDLNIKSAFLHLMADAIVSAGLVIGGIVILYTNLYWIDAVLSLVIGAVILISTWQLLKSSLRLSLDAVPEDIDLRNVRTKVREIKGVSDVHHIHIWALSTTENALTAHVVVAKDIDMNELEKIKHEIKHELLHLNIQHATLELETENAPCHEPDCADPAGI
ncbi:MAG TPA: cation diffusion facilitator family transporter [Puia sp.]|nr:cation diffusion facilitator family transporter [Puia sp.]